MYWKKYIINTTTKDVDLVSAVLYENGISDIQIVDNVQLTDEELNQMYADFVKELPPDDGTCSVNFYLDEDFRIPGASVGTGDSPSVEQGERIDIRALEEALKEAEMIYGIEPVTIETYAEEAGDWENKWKEFFKPFEVDDIIIKPTWEAVPEDADGKVVINIDPGMAFGTGMHETTRLCLKGLSKYMNKGGEVLDIGCGSGILGIAALKLGASSVHAIDIDEQAVKVAYENFELNTSEDILPDAIKLNECNTGSISVESDISDYGQAIAENPDRKRAFSKTEQNNQYEGTDFKERASAGRIIYQLYVGNILQDEKIKIRIAERKYDIVLANILAEVIEPLIAEVHNYMKPQAVFISSGILKEKEQMIIDAVSENHDLELLETINDGDWCSVIVKRIKP